jgi:hypothetical protein
MKVGKQQGEWKKAAQAVAEKQAMATAREIWLAYWKKVDRARQQQQRAKKSA